MPFSRCHGPRLHHGGGYPAPMQLRGGGPVGDRGECAGGTRDKAHDDRGVRARCVTQQNAPGEPESRSTHSPGGVSIADQVLGDAERDLVLVPGWIFNLEVVWEHPSFEAFMKRLLRNFRVIMFDKRGT